MKLSKIKNAFLKRAKNYAFWTSLIALVGIYAKAAGYIEFSEEWDIVANAFLTFLVAAGIVSNPTTENNWYLDDKAEV